MALGSKSNPKAVYEYASALRGPDNDSLVFKEMMTCVIRGNHPCGPLDIRDTKQRLESNSDSRILDLLRHQEDSVGSHFLLHSKWGLMALVKYFSMSKTMTISLRRKKGLQAAIMALEKGDYAAYIRGIRIFVGIKEP